MKILLKYDWFAPSELVEVTGRNVSGILYKAGEHVVSDDLKSKLPRSAKILDEMVEPVKKKVDKQHTLRDFDEERANSEAFVRISNKVK